MPRYGYVHERDKPCCLEIATFWNAGTVLDVDAPEVEVEVEYSVEGGIPTAALIIDASQILCSSLLDTTIEEQ